MKRILGQVWLVVGLLAIGALGGVLVVTMLDPACGPWGDEQKACAAEIADDLTGGR